MSFSSDLQCTVDSAIQSVKGVKVREGLKVIKALNMVGVLCLP